MKEPGSTNVDPIFTNNKLPDGNEPGCAWLADVTALIWQLCSAP